MQVLSIRNTWFFSLALGLLCSLGLGNSNVWARAYHHTGAPQSMQGGNIGAVDQTLDDIEKNKDTGNIQKQAEKASNTQNATMIISTIATGIMGMKAASTCSACASSGSQCTQCPMWILGTALGAMTAMNMSKAKSQSDGSRYDVSLESPEISPPEFTENENPLDSEELQKTQARLNTIAKNGGPKMDLASGKLTMPNGTQVDLNNASPSDLAAAGFGPGEQAEISKMLNDAFKQAEEQAGLGVDKIEGDVLSEGEGGAASLAGIEYIDEFLSGKSAGNSKKINRDPAQIAGLTKNFNGDPIGVASENLFTLINRRYDVKAKTDTFILKAK